MLKFWKKNPKTSPVLWEAQRERGHPFSMLDGYVPLSDPETKLYEAIREGVPVVDSAIQKVVRLSGGFSVLCQSSRAQQALDRFVQQVQVGGSGKGLEQFAAAYLDSLLTYGNAVGEIVLTRDRKSIAGLYLAPLEQVEIRQGKTPLEVEFYVRTAAGERKKAANQNLILFTALNPKAGECRGVSLLRSLPFVTGILFKIYHSIGQNFDRIGNIRYAVTYHPPSDGISQAYAKERAQMIAKEWSDGMNAGAMGKVKDFITVGDVDIKVIGADSQMIDTQVPVRQMLEQIVAKLSIPPFLLGLSWSTTERMSKQQTDILTTELEFYRRLMTPVILKICTAFFRLQGIWEQPQIQWNTINLKDEVESAQARYYLARAMEIEQKLTQDPKEMQTE